MYKDSDKQREANKLAAKKYRDSMTGKGMTIIDERPNEPSNVIPKRSSYRILNDGPINIETSPKRGKEIKTFADLSPDVQQTIDKMAMIDGKIDKTIKANRTAIAINYQHLFPGRFHSVGVAGRSPI